jgi:hypothetical protein
VAFLATLIKKEEGKGEVYKVVSQGEEECEE